MHHIERAADGTTDIRAKLDRGVWPICVDRNELEIALINLAINARDAVSSGGKLTVETSNVRLDGDYAALHLARHDRQGLSPATA